jgi:hypothetical protein
MNNYYYIPFFLFIIAAYIYYQRKGKREQLFYRTRRIEFLDNNKNLTEEQSNNLSHGLPWNGMESGILIELFGEPRRKRVMDQSMTRTIWSYGELFVYIDDDRVIEWKRR